MYKRSSPRILPHPLHLTQNPLFTPTLIQPPHQQILFTRRRRTLRIRHPSIQIRRKRIPLRHIPHQRLNTRTQPFLLKHLPHPSPCLLDNHKRIDRLHRLPKRRRYLQKMCAPHNGFRFVASSSVEQRGVKEHAIADVQRQRYIILFKEGFEFRETCPRELSTRRCRLEAEMVVSMRDLGVCARFDEIDLRG
ncbi:unnamed protein product [Periconia digitata]|uniref:Uncharacterized protein n=1 Tax=Periconia digitata TaxID=1303443 RepID=A0A9W4U3Y5_9PLEO|nr:unnamed protein product [Periconia digitata]